MPVVLLVVLKEGTLLEILDFKVLIGFVILATLSVAERVGFEPTIPSRVYRLSKAAH